MPMPYFCSSPKIEILNILGVAFRGRVSPHLIKTCFITSFNLDTIIAKLMKLQNMYKSHETLSLSFRSLLWPKIDTFRYVNIISRIIVL